MRSVHKRPTTRAQIDIDIIKLVETARDTSKYLAAKWHRCKMEGAFAETEQCIAFRQELNELHQDLKKYANLLADIAEVEYLTEIETE